LDTKDEGALLPIATGLRLRGPGGRLTATVVEGGIDQLRGREWILVGRAPGPATRYRVETYTAYGRKVAIKLAGIDDPDAAGRLVGLDILLPCNGLLALPEGAYYIFELVGMRVTTRAGRDLGTVRRVDDTGAAPLLVVAPTEGGPEILIPAARSICTTIDRDARRIEVEPPEGLLEIDDL
jgi:16S rRNA processing protein RimM